jgi:hypothetical protein
MQRAERRCAAAVNLTDNQPNALQHCNAPRKESNDHIQYCRWKDNKAKEIVTALAALYQTRTKTATFRSKPADGSETAALGGGAMARKRLEAPRFD